MTNRFRNFLIVGGIAALMNWGSRFGFQQVMSFGEAVIAAYIVGMATAYALSRLFVFEASGRVIADEAARFALVNLFAAGVVWLVTMGLARFAFPAIGFTWHADAVAHGVGVLSPAVTSYLGHRHFTFSKPATDIGTSVSPGPAPNDWPLAVDMDGTLLRTDVLAETVIAGLFRRPLAMFGALLRLRSGRAAFKAAISQALPIDVATLPARDGLVAYLRAEKARGRHVCLVTAAAADPARRVAARFDLFDEVHASSDTLNLRGPAKLARLRSLFPDGFAYAGDSQADLAVWAGAKSIIIAGAGRGLADRARTLGPPVEAEFDIGGVGPSRWGEAFRLHQWSKNLLLFAPILLGTHVRDLGAWAACLAGFLSLGVAASATYLINDLADLESDRGHRSKCRRALASGDIAGMRALSAAVAMIVAALVAALLIGRQFLPVLLVYLVTTLSYSFRLKRVPLLDVIVLGCLYTLRLIAGTLLAGSDFSPWLLTFAMFFFLSMSLAKRHVEVSTASGPPDLTLPGRGYRPSDAALTLSIGVATSAAAVLIIVQYMMTEAFPSGVYAFPAALWAAPLVLGLWVCRIWLLAHRGELDDDPVAFAVKDRISLALGGVLGMAFLAARFA